MSNKTRKNNPKTMIINCDDFIRRKANSYLKMCKENSSKCLKNQFNENTNESTENGICFIVNLTTIVIHFV